MMSPHRLSVGALLLLATGYVAVHYCQQCGSQRRIIAASRVSVVMVRSTFPPELVVEFENAGQAEIGRTHFRLSFEVKGREISRADEDVLNMLPKEKRQVILRSHPSGPSVLRTSGTVRASYTLVVLPEWLKGLPALSGDFVLGP